LSARGTLRAVQTRFIDKGEMLLAGVACYGEPSKGLFKRAWGRLGKRFGHIGNRVNERECFGLELYGPEFHAERVWTYLAAVEVTSLEELPMDMVARKIPASTYAVFTVHGAIEAIGPAFRQIYDTWLPSSGYELRHPYDFELYDERFNLAEPDKSAMDIYVPVAKKSP
jgi:AraC family transcriptional regulator